MQMNFNMENVATMNMEEIRNDFPVLRDLNIPMFITGAVGIGKSDTVRSLAREHHMALIDERVFLYDSTDFKFPIVKGDTVRWKVPPFLPTKETRRGGILFLDELTSAQQAVQAVLYQLILDGKIGDYKLPKGWYIIAAGNGALDRAVVNKMSSALNDRFLQIDARVDNDAWTNWALDNDIPIEIISFLKLEPELLHNFDKQKNPKKFPTPRSWARVAKLMGKIDFNNHPTAYPLLSGLVGESAAATFLGFLQIWKSLPNPDNCFIHPDTAEIPVDRPDVMYALTGALSKKANQDNFPNLLRYLERMPVEFNVLCVTNAKRENKTLIDTNVADFTQWNLKYKDIL